MELKNRKHKLNRKLIFYFTLVIMLGIILIGIIVNLIVEKKFGQYVSYKNEQEISNIIEDIKVAYKNNDWNKKYINDIGANALNKGILIDVYDEHNDLVWSAREYNEDKCNRMLGSIKDNMKRRYNNWDSDYREDKFKITSNGNEVGYLNIGYYGNLYYLDDELDFLRDINKVITIIAIVLIIISVIISVIISNSISKPIEKVSKFTKTIEDGNYEKKIEYKSNLKEVDDLINSINNLTDTLNKQEELRKRLTTDVAHELRTPLTSVQTHLEAILDGIWEPTNDRLNSINEEVSRLVGLVNKLNSLSKFEASKENLNIKEENLSKIVENIIYNFQTQAIKKSIRIESDLDDVNINIDKDKITQLVINLISNGIRYTNEGGKINIILKDEKNCAKLCIKDNGIGIPKEDIKYIFERFYRVDKSRSKNTGGMGVGLTISKAIVKAHGGSINVNSQIGTGSEFIVIIPKK